MKYFKYFIPPNLFICINKWSNWRYDPFAGCEIKVLKKICQINGEKNVGEDLELMNSSI